MLSTNLLCNTFITLLIFLLLIKMKLNSLNQKSKPKLRVKKRLTCKLRRQPETGQYSITIPQHLALAKEWDNGDHIAFYTNERGNMELIKDN